MTGARGLGLISYKRSIVWKTHLVVGDDELLSAGICNFKVVLMGEARCGLDGMAGGRVPVKVGLISPVDMKSKIVTKRCIL